MSAEGHERRDDKIRRSWFKGTATGRVFRNCPLIKSDRSRYAPGSPEWNTLTGEWWTASQRGDMSPGSEYNPAEPGRDDVFIDFDDSPEATQAWAEEFVRSHGKFRE